MSARKRLWLISFVLYALFFIWYTDLGGPLSKSEIQQWHQTMSDNGMANERISYYEKFLKEDTGRQFLMVNAIDMNENPPFVEGAEAGDTAEQLMSRYMEHMFKQLLMRASHPVIVGTAPFSVIDVVGLEGADNWDQGAIFRYRSRRTFMEIIANPNMSGRHHFKLAALDKTIAYPIETSLYLGDLRLILGLFLLSITALLDSFLLSRRR
jgi:hypothetical protein